MSNSEYFYCYMLGREDGETDAERLSTDVTYELARKYVRSGAVSAAAVGGLREMALAVAKRSLAKTEANGTKRTWLAENREEIAEAGGDTEGAWALYLKGRTDALALAVEELAVGEIVDIIDRKREEDEDDEEDLEEEEDGDEDGEAEEDVEEEESDEDDDPDDDEDVEPDVAPPPSFQARYRSWEEQGVRDAGMVLPAEVTGNKRLMRLDWRKKHLDSVTQEGLRPAKAFARWLAGWERGMRELGHGKGPEA